MQSNKHRKLRSIEDNGAIYDSRIETRKMPTDDIVMNQTMQNFFSKSFRDCWGANDQTFSIAAHPTPIAMIWEATLPYFVNRLSCTFNFPVRTMQNARFATSFYISVVSFAFLYGPIIKFCLEKKKHESGHIANLARILQLRPTRCHWVRSTTQNTFAIYHCVVRSKID